MNNIKTLLKDFLKQQSELATVKENYYVLKNGLSDVIKSNQDYIGDESRLLLNYSRYLIRCCCGRGT